MIKIKCQVYNFLHCAILQNHVESDVQAAIFWQRHLKKLLLLERKSGVQRSQPSLARTEKLKQQKTQNIASTHPCITVSWMINGIIVCERPTNTGKRSLPHSQLRKLYVYIFHATRLRMARKGLHRDICMQRMGYRVEGWSFMLSQQGRLHHSKAGSPVHRALCMQLHSRAKTHDSQWYILLHNYEKKEIWLHLNVLQTLPIMRYLKSVATSGFILAHSPNYK